MWALRPARGAISQLVGTSRAAARALPTCSRPKATLATTLHAQDPDRVALVAPAQNLTWTYGDLSACVGHLSGGLAAIGYGAGDVIATDLASVAENLILQLAASHLGAAVLTCKSAKDLDTHAQALPVRGAVVTGSASFLASAALPFPHLYVEPVEGHRTLKEVYEEKQGQPAPSENTSAPLGYYATGKPITNAAALEAGAAVKGRLGMTEKDIVLVSITLNHIFGIGSAVSGALQSGAAIVLPDASGVVGCGVPSQRASATLQYLESCQCTLLFADTHTYKALTALEPAGLSNLRGGICKVGSGTTFLEPTVELAGVSLVTMGKA